jgi:hypothetical protein
MRSLHGSDARALRGLPMNNQYVVLDQNVVNDASVVGPLRARYRRTGQRIVLSSSARYEMTKGGLDGLMKDIAELSKDPQSVFIAQPPLRIGGLEAERRRPVGDIVDRASSQNFQGLIRAISDGSLSSDQLVEGFAHEQVAAARRLDVVDWDSFYLKTAAALANPGVSSDEERRRVRKGLDRKPPSREPLRHALLETFADHSRLVALVEGLKPVSSVADRLCSFPSMVALDIMANITVAYYWAIKGDTRTRRKTKMVNEAIDVEGAVLGCRGVCFATRDERALGLFEDLRFFMKEIWGA